MINDDGCAPLDFIPTAPLQLYIIMYRFTVDAIYLLIIVDDSKKKKKNCLTIILIESRWHQRYSIGYYPKIVFKFAMPYIVKISVQYNHYYDYNIRTSLWLFEYGGFCTL